MLFTLACLFGYTINIVEADHGTYTQLIAFFVGLNLPRPEMLLTWLACGSSLWRRVLDMAYLCGSNDPTDPNWQHHCNTRGGSALDWKHSHGRSPSASINMVCHCRWYVDCSLLASSSDQETDLFGGLALLFLHRGSKHISKSFGERMANLFEFIPGEYAVGGPNLFREPLLTFYSCQH